MPSKALCTFRTIYQIYKLIMTVECVYTLSAYVLRYEYNMTYKIECNDLNRCC